MTAIHVSVVVGRLRHTLKETLDDGSTRISRSWATTGLKLKEGRRFGSKVQIREKFIVKLKLM
jgi:hypothetical protein